MSSEPIGRGRNADRGEVRENRDSLQSVSRAAAILRLLAQRAPRAARLIDIAAAAGLPLSTTRRILKTLIEENLVAQEADRRSYHLGPLIFEFGMIAAAEPPTLRICDAMPVIQQLARKTEDQVTLIGRSNAEVVCHALVEGSKAIDRFPLQVGTRRPLGVGAGGFAILAQMADEEADRIINVNLKEVQFFGRWTPDSIWRAVERTRDRGYGVSVCRIAPEVRSVGMVLPNYPDYAITVMGDDARIFAGRIDELAAMLRAACNEIEDLVLRRPAP